MKHVRKGTPECFHVYGGFEHKENVSVVVGVECFAFRAKIFCTVGTAVPLSSKARRHVSIATHRTVRKATKIG
jgi:hypothetical protein